MANLSKVIYINEEDYSTLLNGGTITKGGVTYSHDPTALYVIKNVSAPEYAETAGYATTAGQATKATQDGGGNVISETYAKKVIVGEITYDDQEEEYNCNKTYSQLSSALLGGDVVLLKYGSSVYYPSEYPYLDENDNITGSLRFKYVGSEGYYASFTIYRANNADVIDYEESNVEDYLGESIYYQRTVLKLTIGQNNALTFKDQDNNTITTTRAYYTLTNNRNDLDVVIQYSGCEYHKSSFGHLDELSFSSVDNGIISYLVFNCSTANTVTLVSTGYNYILTENVDFGQAYGISSDNSNSAARTSSISGFKLKKGGIVAIKFTTDINITNPKLNINSTGSKPIYYRGSTLLRGTINAGDTVTFIYDGTYYHIISIDPNPATTAPIMDGTAAVGSSTKYAREDHVHPSDTSKANVADLATVATSGSYNDLINKPTIPAAVTVDSSLTGSSQTNPVQGGAIYNALAEKEKYIEYDYESELLSDMSQPHGTIAYEGDNELFYFYDSHNGKWIRILDEYSIDTVIVPISRKINNKPLSSDITLNASDVGADVFVVNIENDGSNGYTCDKTNAEIYAAWQAGRNIVLIRSGEYLYKLNVKPTQTYCEFSGDDYDDLGGYNHYSIFTSNGQQKVTEGSVFFQEYLQSGTNIKTINNLSLLGSGNLTPSDLGAITRFVVDFTLSGTTISNPNKTFLQIKAAYDAGNLVLARDNNSSLYYLLYCDTGNCGFFNCDSNYLYDINVDSSNVWRYQVTDISQLSHDLSNKSEVIYMRKVNNVWRKLTYDSLNGNWIIDSAALTTGNIKNIYFDKDNNDLYYWDGSAFVLVDEDNVQPDWDQSDSTKADYIKNKPVIPNSVKVGSVAGKLYRNDVNGSGNFTVKGNSGCIPNLTAGTFLVSIYAKSATQSYTFKFNFGSVSYNLSTTNGEINDVREITIPSDGTFSGSVLNGSVASGTILYVVMYNYLTTISTVGPAAVTNRYSDLDGIPNIPTVNNGTLTIQKNGTTVQTFTANQSSSVIANITVPTTASDIDAVPTVISTTYNDLVTARTNSQLIEGAWYRITDYVCTTAQTDTQSAEHQFDILVQAVSPNKLSEEARATRHEGDTYFANSNLEAWKIWYCLDNDVTRFAWANPTNGKGVIYHMIDEWGNDCPYDFKNIQFKRWAITSVKNHSNQSIGDLEDAFKYDSENNPICFGYKGSGYQMGRGSCTVDSNTSVFYYTFSRVESDGNITDNSIVGNTLGNDEDLYQGVINNVFKPSSNGINEVYGINDTKTCLRLCDNVFVSTSVYDEDMPRGVFGNTFGTGCHHNTFGNECKSNTFGNYCSSNTFGNDYSLNTFGNYCSLNTFGNECLGNSFGSNVSHNTFGKYCSSNTFGHECFRNFFGNYLLNNIFGNYFQDNILGNICNSNTFGNDVNNVIFSKDCIYYVIIENGNRYITLTSTQTTSSSNLLRNITIAQGVNNTTTTKTISHNTLNDAFRTTYTVDDSGNIYAITPTKYSEWDNKQSTLISGTNIKTINNQSLLGSGNIEIESGGNVTVENVTDTGDVIKSLEPNIFYKFGTVDSLTIPLIAGTELAVYAGKFTISSSSTASSFLIVPSTVTVAYSCPTISVGNTYEFSIADNVLLMAEV